MKNTIVYIDGFNLYYGCLKKTPRYKWLDLNKLCTLLLDETHNIVGIKYFTSRVRGQFGNNDPVIRQQVYFRALRTIPKLEIILGHIRIDPKWYPLVGLMKMEQVWIAQEKQSDVNLACHFLIDCFFRKTDFPVLISNDSDQSTPLGMACNILHMNVGLISPNSRTINGKLLISKPTFIKHIRKDVLERSQFPDTMHDTKGKFHRPVEWN